MKQITTLSLAALMLFTGTAVHAQEATVETTVEVNMKEPRILPRPGMIGDLRPDILDRRMENKKEMDEHRKDAMEARMEVRETRMEEKGEAMEERRMEMKERFDAQTETMRMRFQEQFAKRSLRVVAQIENLMMRFKTHMEKLVERGLDVTEAEAQIVVAETAYAEAKVKIEALKDLYPTTGEEWSEETRQAAAQAKMEAEVAIKNVHKELRTLLDTIKKIRVSANAETSVE